MPKKRMKRKPAQYRRKRAIRQKPEPTPAALGGAEINPVQMAPAPQNTMGGLESDLAQAREALGSAEANVRADEVALVNSKVDLQIAQAREAMAAEALRHATNRLLLGERL